MLGASLLRLRMRPLEPVAIILRTIGSDMKSLTLQLLGTQLLGIAADELRATPILQLRLLARVLEFLLANA